MYRPHGQFLSFEKYRLSKGFVNLVLYLWKSSLINYCLQFAAFKKLFVGFFLCQAFQLWLSVTLIYRGIIGLWQEKFRECRVQEPIKVPFLSVKLGRYDSAAACRSTKDSGCQGEAACDVQIGCATQGVQVFFARFGPEQAINARRITLRNLRPL